MRFDALVTALALAFLVAPLGCHKDQASGGASKVEVTADEKGFTPSSVETKKGAPITLVFTRTTDDTCATQVVFPDLKITKDLPLKQPVAIEVPATAARTLTFRCGMGMFKGKVVVD